ncbi:hypothetical protein ACIA8G_21415 [Lentzea sp. NPDC051213]|uniref:hypothetical protein n=1 Tax=Lentzea sp. NPDC051213 TaxID=3364126 RepID=UPI0037BBFB74
MLIVYGVGDVLGAGLGAGFLVFASTEPARRWRHQDDAAKSATNGSETSSKRLIER